MATELIVRTTKRLTVVLGSGRMLVLCAEKGDPSIYLRCRSADGIETDCLTFTEAELAEFLLVAQREFIAPKVTYRNADSLIGT